MEWIICGDPLLFNEETTSLGFFTSENTDKGEKKERRKEEREGRERGGRKEGKKIKRNKQTKRNPSVVLKIGSIL